MMPDAQAALCCKVGLSQSASDGIAFDAHCVSDVLCVGLTPLIAGRATDVRQCAAVQFLVLTFLTARLAARLA
jgi:hypothetical protein